MKYWAVFKITVRNWLEYALDNSIVLSRTIIYFFALYFLWINVFAHQQNLFGYTLSSIITYVFVSFAIRNFVLATRVDQVANQISHGEFFSFLLRPLSIVGYWLSLDAAYKILDLILASAALAVVALILRPALTFNISPFSTVAFLLSLLSGSLVYFLLIFAVAITTFWYQNNWGFQFGLSLLIEFTSGLFFPIDVLPHALGTFIKATPFPYMVWLPANILSGRASTPEIFMGLAISLSWTVFLTLAVSLLFKKGLRTYSAEGG